MNIQINFKSSVTDNILVKIDDKHQNYQLIDKTLSIVTELTHGLHYLEFQSSVNMHEIEFIVIDGSYLRQSLYLGWGMQGTTRIQPCTHFNNEIKMILPFGYPVSWWSGETNRQVDNGHYGKDLTDIYKLFWPESIRINESFPPLVKDFYYYNHGFTAIKNELRSKLPYQQTNLKFDTTPLLNEIMQNESLWKKKYFNPGSTAYDKAEIQQESYWEKINFYQDGEGGWLLGNDDFPVLHKFLDNLPINRLIYAFVGKLDPGTYISPHTDRYYTDPVKHGRGCMHMYIPITWAPGNFFKMQNVGILPIEEGVPILMNLNYQHSLINQSDEVRYVIQTVCDFTGTPWEGSNEYINFSK